MQGWRGGSRLVMLSRPASRAGACGTAPRTAAGSAGGWRRPTGPAPCARGRAAPLRWQGIGGRAPQSMPPRPCIPAQQAAARQPTSPVKRASTTPSAWMSTDVRSSTCWPAAAARVARRCGCYTAAGGISSAGPYDAAPPPPHHSHKCRTWAIHRHLAAFLALPPAALPPDVATCSGGGGRRGDGGHACAMMARRVEALWGGQRAHARHSCCYPRGAADAPEALTALPKLRVR